MASRRKSCLKLLSDRSVSMMKSNFSVFSDLMNQRRAIRVFNGTPVPEQIVRECLSLTMLSPSSSNLIPWELHWVRSKELHEELVRAFIGQSAARTASELVVAVARTKTWDENRREVIAALKSYGSSVHKRVFEYYEDTIPGVYNQGRFGLRGLMKRILNFFWGINRAIVRAPASHSDMRIWAVKSTSMACQSLILALQSHGIDTCPMEGMDAKRLAKLLKLPPDAFVVMGIAIGYRSYNGINSPRIRLAEEKFIKEV